MKPYVGSKIRVKQSEDTSIYLRGFGFSLRDIREFYETEHEVIKVFGVPGSGDSRYYIEFLHINYMYLYPNEISTVLSEEDLEEWV